MWPPDHVVRTWKCAWGKPTITRWRGPIGRGEKGQECLYFIHRFKRIFAAGKPQKSQKPRLHILPIHNGWIQGGCRLWLTEGLRMWLKPSGVGGKGEGRCLERGPSLHQNHLELLQNLKFIPVFLAISLWVVVLSKKKKKNRFQFVQVWENRKVLLK